MNNSKIEKLSTLSLLYITEESSTAFFIGEQLTPKFKTMKMLSTEEEALTFYHERKPDFILSDISSARLNVIEFITEIRKIDKKVQIALIYAYEDIYKLLHVVELNIIKIIVRPPTLNDLEILLKTFSKEYVAPDTYYLPKAYYINALWIFEPNHYRIKGPSYSYSLTKIEWTFLSILFRQNKIITYYEMKKYVWKDFELNDNAIHTFIKKIRKKLPPKTLQTLKGVGYKITS